MTSPVGNDPVPAAQAQQSAALTAIAEGYIFDEPAIELGVLMQNDDPIPSAVVRIPLAMLNRHGLIGGATGPGFGLALCGRGRSAAARPGRTARCADASDQRRGQVRARDRAERDARPTPRPRREDSGLLADIVSSTTFHQAARTATTQIVRSIFGTARRRR